MIVNDINLPSPILNAMRNNTYTAGNADYTPSSLAYGAKEYWGRKTFRGLNSRASTLWASFTGTLMHLGLEHLLKAKLFCTLSGKCITDTYPCKEKEEIFSCLCCEHIEIKRDNGYKTELHLEVPFNEVSSSLKLPVDRIIGGTIDLLEVAGNTIIWDYKTMSTSQIINEEKVKEWTEKANIYAWLLMETKTVQKIDKIFYVPIFKDWTATKAERSRDIYDSPCPTIRLEIYDKEKIEKSIYDKVMKIEKYRLTKFEEIPYCSREERWEDKMEYKVCKVTDGQMKRAVSGGVFNTEEEAMDFLTSKLQKAKMSESYGIKRTGGIPKKCAKWCILSQNGKCDYMTTIDKVEDEE